MSTKELTKKVLRKVTRSSNGHTHSKKGRATSMLSRILRSNLPSNVIMWAGVACVAAAAVLNATGRRTIGRLLSQLGGPVLIMGLYNRKLSGSGLPEVRW